MGVSAREQLAKDIDTIERAYEFFLAYAAQGLGREAEGTRVEGQFREYLTGMLDASNRLAGTVDRLLEEEQVSSRTQLVAFRGILQADAQRAAAALALVQAQPVASSQLVDNLNASVHVRTLLTDLFLLDEVLELAAGKAASEV